MNVLQIRKGIRNTSFHLCFCRERDRIVNADRAKAKAVSSQIRLNRAEELLVQKCRMGTTHPVISTARPPPSFSKARRQQSPRGKCSPSPIQMSLRTVNPMTLKVSCECCIFCVVFIIIMSIKVIIFTAQKVIS